MGTTLPADINNDRDLSAWLNSRSAAHIVHGFNLNAFDPNEPLHTTTYNGTKGFWVCPGDGTRQGVQKPWPNHQHGWLERHPDTGKRIEVGPDDVRYCGYTWDEAVALSAPAGTEFGRFKKFDVWVTRNIAEALGFVASKFDWGTPCRVHDCRRVAPTGNDGTCKMHAAAARRAAEGEAAREAEWTETRARWARLNETRRSAEETLDRIAPLLTALGLRPDTFTATEHGIVCPPEAVELLTEMADKFADLEGSVG